MIEDDTFYIWGEECIVSKISSEKGIKLEEQFLFVFNRIEQTKHNLMMGALSMNKEDEKLLQYYLELKGPNAGEWNSSPQCLHTQLVTRDYVRRHSIFLMKSKYVMLVSELEIGTITLDIGLREEVV
ncbi:MULTISPECIES: hypothetical protein [Paenibacillus]|jgi:hypothetical protein|uniref:hypothetical protein n=1 Tax=Paenibacillus TaxID=44249 RepID=UPI0003D37736|nr:hypothetical protein [Paenibacillus polymyxa]